MLPKVTNILRIGSDGAIGEQVSRLLDSPAFRLEQIVSNGEASAKDFWYDQPEAEWVLLVRGKAILRFQGDRSLGLDAGDSVVIPAHSRHRVDSCSQDALWLTLHFRADQPRGPGPALGATYSP
jgi:cupin 2 domain-containing protein